MAQTRRQRLKGLPFNRMIPSILTVLALCAGMTAIRFGLQDRWEPAVVFILIAAVLDGLDGRIARMLKGQSKFGAELDSLSDFISFGVAPAVLLYLWSMQSAGRVGWVLVLLFSVCCALRLARFNTALEEPDRPAWAYNYFTGVPSPAGAGLVLLPMILSFQVAEGFFRQPWVVAVMLLTVAGLLVSRVPTYAFKSFRVPTRWVLPTMLLVGVLAASIVAATWPTMTALLLIYAVSIPFAVRSYGSLARKAAELRGTDDSILAAGADEDEEGPDPPA